MTRQGTPAEMVDLSGRVALVTGAGGGIGAGIVRRFVAAGATVVAHTRHSPVDHLRTIDGAPVDTVAGDLAEPGVPDVLVDEVLARHGRLDVLVNNAGIQPVEPFVELADESWTSMIDVNLTAVHRLTHAVVTTMAASGAGGAVVHIASIEAHHPTPMHGHYATAKAGLVMHARAAALAWGPRGVRVNVVSPGLIDAPGLADAWPEGVERWLAAAPLGRLGTPEDVGDACVVLCSDLARWITGAELVVDGGVLTNPTW